MTREKIIEALKLPELERPDRIAAILGVPGELSEIGFIEDILDEGHSPEVTADILLEEYDDEVEDEDVEDVYEDEDDE